MRLRVAAGLVSAIARHTGRDRKTVRKYLAGPAAMREPAPSCLEPFREYLLARFVDDVHVDGTVLHHEVVELGFDRSYVTFARQLRLLGLRPRGVPDRWARRDRRACA